MPKEIVLPELAESVVEGEILKWLVPEGGRLYRDQPFVEVMTDKVTVDLPSPYSGILSKHLVAEGQIVKVHAPLAVVLEEGEVSTPVPAAPPADAGESLSLFKPDTRQEVVQNPFAAAVQADSALPSTPAGRLLAVPAARKLARDRGVDLRRVQGSGPNGRIRVQDVQNHLAAPTLSTSVVAPVPQAGLPVPAPVYRSPKGYEDREERIPLRGLRRAISQQMWASHLYTVRTLSVDEADLTELVALRQRLKPEAESRGVKLSYLPFIFKAIVKGLQKYPALNTSLDEARQEVVRKHYYHLGLAVATETGLVVPVVRDVDRKSILEVGREIQELAQKAREGRLEPADMGGSSFSVTNIGSIGALFSFPIINVPDAAILGVHSIQKRPVVLPDDRIVARQMMYLSLSFDHRVVDGAEAALFCKEVIRWLEQPELMLLEAV